MFACYNSATSLPVAVQRKVSNAVKAALEWWGYLDLLDNSSISTFQTSYYAN